MERVSDPEVLISVDVEASGPSPSSGSLIAIGACLVDSPETAFYRELAPIAGIAWDTATEQVHGLTREHLSANAATAPDGMTAFRDWITSAAGPGRPVMVGLNVAFDWMFVADYFARFGMSNPFGVAPLDLKALYMGRFSVKRWSDTGKASIVRRIHVELPHTHQALEDARMQAQIAVGLLAAPRRRR